MSFYNQNHQTSSSHTINAKVKLAGNPTAVTVTRRQLEEWVKRLRQFADEAGWGENLTLESDILDLRDEISKLLR